MRQRSIDVQFQLDGDTLAVRGKLRTEERDALADGLKEFAEVTTAAPVLDITGVDIIVSECLAVIAMAMKDAKEAGQTATVLAKPGVAWVLELAGLDKLGEVRSVGE